MVQRKSENEELESRRRFAMGRCLPAFYSELPPTNTYTGVHGEMGWGILGGLVGTMLWAAGEQYQYAPLDDTELSRRKTRLAM